MFEFPSQKTITYSRVIHLSHLIDRQIPLWPGDPPVEFEPAAELNRDGYYLRRFSMGEHSATHMNAPNSFHAEGAGIDAYPAESLVVPAVVVDIRARAGASPDFALTPADVLQWEREYGQIPTGTVVLLYTGWQEKWPNPDAFLNGGRFPGFAGETARFLLDERGIAGVGTDTHGVDGCDATFATNRLVLERGGIVLENLTNLHQLPSTGTTLAIGILRLRGGSGSPAGVIAFVP
ncbi:MAG: cyclase family protein [Oscillatoria sp. Prado101]|jgi:kynurenine formamidase|nr:cyclase family protein [Oscillatoria sp. Prado101]